MRSLATFDVSAQTSRALRISATVALRAHTYGGAVSLGREDDLGPLEVGECADFAVLTDDPLGVAAERISSVVVRKTGVDGERRHGDGIVDTRSES